MDHRRSIADPLDGHGNPLEVTRGTWSSPPASWPESPFVGASYAGFVKPGAKEAAFVPVDAGSGAFAGTGLHDGQAVPGVLASGLDGLGPARAFPGDVQVLARSPIPIADVQTDEATANGLACSDMTYCTDPNKGSVWGTGTNSRIPAIAACPPARTGCPSGVVRRVTATSCASSAGAQQGAGSRPDQDWQGYLVGWLRSSRGPEGLVALGDPPPSDDLGDEPAAFRRRLTRGMHEHPLTMHRPASASAHRGHGEIADRECHDRLLQWWHRHPCDQRGEQEVAAPATDGDGHDDGQASVGGCEVPKRRPLEQLPAFRLAEPDPARPHTLTVHERSGLPREPRATRDQWPLTKGPSAQA